MTCTYGSRVPFCSITGKEVDRHTESWNSRQWEKDERKRVARLEMRGRNEWWSNMLWVGAFAILICTLIAIGIWLNRMQSV